MQRPPTAPETLLEELWHALPPETVPLAREVPAFARARQRQPPEPLWRVVVVYGGVEKAWRAVAGTVPALYEPSTDQAGGPWSKAVLRTLLPPPAVTAWPQGLRFVVIDATTGQAPGATGPDQRLHLSLALGS